MIIGICGLARSGKDTFAELLAEELFNVTKQKYILIAYAHELKLRTQRDFDFSYDQLWGDLKEVSDERYSKDSETFWTPREVLQVYGQFFRTINPNFWVDTLFKVIEEKEYKNVIVTDIRYPNEAWPIKERKGLIFKIQRDNRDFCTNSNHISETAMIDFSAFDFVVDNNGTLDDLRNTAKQAVVFIKSMYKYM